MFSDNLLPFLTSPEKIKEKEKNPEETYSAGGNT